MAAPSSTSRHTVRGDALVAATLAGLGISHQPSFLVAGPVAEGRLVRLLPDWTGFASAFWALWPSRHPSAAVRSLVEALVERLGEAPGATAE